MNWLEIADACEKAIGPSRKIDWELHVSVRYDGCGSYGNHPKYTASLDAIVALIERDLPECFWSTERWPGGSNADLTAYENLYEARSATPALALCAAFCRARAELAGDA